MYTGSTGPWHAATNQAFTDAFDVVAATAPFYPPAPAPGAVLEPEIVTRMGVIARLINANLGFRVLTAGWADFDSHAGQPDMHFVQLVSFGCGCDAITSDECRRLLERTIQPSAL